jgi:allantoin racemase
VESIVKKTGLGDRCASVRCVDLPVLACESDPEAIVAGLERVSRIALTEDGAEAIILGCAGMGGLAETLTQQLGVPCVDAVAAGVRFAELLIAMNLHTSKWLTYRAPESKIIRGLEKLITP